MNLSFLEVVHIFASCFSFLIRTEARWIPQEWSVSKDPFIFKKLKTHGDPSSKQGKLWFISGASWCKLFLPPKQRQLTFSSRNVYPRRCLQLLPFPRVEFLSLSYCKIFCSFFLLLSMTHLCLPFPRFSLFIFILIHSVWSFEFAVFLPFVRKCENTDILKSPSFFPPFEFARTSRLLSAWRQYRV